MTPFNIHKSTLVLFLLSLTVACSPQMEPIVFGEDHCSFCKMSIVDQRYGAELVTSKGKVYKYDAIECMFNAQCTATELKGETVHSTYVVDYHTPGTLIEASSAYFLHSKTLPSPMGMFLTGTASLEAAKTLEQDHPGDVFSMEEASLMVVSKKSCD